MVEAYFGPKSNWYVWVVLSSGVALIKLPDRQYNCISAYLFIFYVIYCHC